MNIGTGKDQNQSFIKHANDETKSKLSNILSSFQHINVIGSFFIPIKEVILPGMHIEAAASPFSD